MARVGALSKKTYWPISGDTLENHEDGVIWEAVRTNTYLDPTSGLHMRYGLLVGRSPEFEEPIVMAIHDRDGSPWLEGISVINRKKAGGHVKYTWNTASETWRS